MPWYYTLEQGKNMKQQKGCSEQSKLWFLFFLFFSLDCQEIILCATDNFVVHNRQFSGFVCVIFFFHILFMWLIQYTDETMECDLQTKIKKL